MPLDVPPPTQVLLLVFASWAAGTAAGGALTRLDPSVQPGHFKVVWLTAAALAAAAGFAYSPLWIAALLCLITFAAIYRRRDREAGLVTAAAAVGVLVGAALARRGGDATLAAFAVAAALLMGSVTNAMLLGHWHLNQPRLGTRPLRRLVRALWAALVVYGAASVWLALQGTGAAGLGGLTAASFVVFSLVLTAMVAHLVRTRSIMSATGILYLEVLLCLVSVFTGSLGALSLAAPAA